MTQSAVEDYRHGPARPAWQTCRTDTTGQPPADHRTPHPPAPGRPCRNHMPGIPGMPSGPAGSQTWQQIPVGRRPHINHVSHPRAKPPPRARPDQHPGQNPTGTASSASPGRPPASPRPSRKSSTKPAASSAGGERGQGLPPARRPSHQAGGPDRPLSPHHPTPPSRNRVIDDKWENLNPCRRLVIEWMFPALTPWHFPRQANRPPTPGSDTGGQVVVKLRRSTSTITPPVPALRPRHTPPGQPAPGSTTR